MLSPSPDVLVVNFADFCSGTAVFLGNPAPVPVDMQITVNGRRVWPEDDSGLPRGLTVVNVGAGEVVVSVVDSSASWSHTWTEPGYCDSLPEPETTEQTCDAAGTVTIPALPDLRTILSSLGGSGGLSPVGEAGAGDTATHTLVWRLNGTEVEPGSVHELGPGSHTLSLYLVPDAEDSTAMLVRSWTVHIVAAECGGGDDVPGVGEEVPGEDEGTGGELPVTGAPTVLVAVVAVALIALGGGLYLLARRRRTTFTA